MTVIRFEKGRTVQHNGETMTIAGTNGLDSVTLRGEDGQYYHVSTSTFIAEQGVEPSVRPKPEKIDLLRLSKAPAWIAAIRPLIMKPRKTRADVKAAGDKLGISVDAVYRAIRRYEQTLRLDDLPPSTRSGGRGKSRLDPKIDKIIDDAISRVVLSRRCYSARHFSRTVHSELQKAGLKVSSSTLSNRLTKIPPFEWMAKRSGYSEARRKLAPLRGKHPDVERPNQIVQIDHWTTDVEVLNNERLALVGRLYLTLAICAKTRVVTGLNLGFDPPGSVPTGLTMISMMTSKDQLLQKHGLKGQVAMPFWGKPEQIHTDNGTDFVGKMMSTSCEAYGIDRHVRPPGGPQYGAYIERLNRNFAVWSKDAPGATGSNPAERKKLRPEATATMTLDDLEKHVLLLLDEYHNTRHTELGKTPMEAYMEYYFGPDGQRHPLPDLRIDDLNLRVDWYPIEFRSVQRYGVKIDRLEYYGEEISYFVTNRKPGDMVEVRRNPFDVTEVYVRHPHEKRWMTLPCTTLNYPRMSIFEHVALLRAFKSDSPPSPRELASFHDTQQQHLAEVGKKTKKAQREQARRDQHEAIRKSQPVTSRSPTTALPGNPVPTGVDPGTRPTSGVKAASVPVAKVSDLDSILAELTPEFLKAQLDE